MRLLILCFILAHPLWGQKSGETCSTKLSLVAFELERGDEELLFNEGKKKVRVSTSSVLNGVDYQGARQLKLFRKGASEKMVASVKLPESCDETIVILLPGERKGSYRAVAVRATLKEFPPASRLLYNLSPADVRGQIGGVPFRLGSKTNTYFKAESEKYCLVKKRAAVTEALEAQPVRMEYQVGKEWKILANTRWFHTPTQRHLIFVYLDQTAKNLILRGVSDTLKTEINPVLAEDGREAPEGKENRITGHPIFGGKGPRREADGSR